MQFNLSQECTVAAWVALAACKVQKPKKLTIHARIFRALKVGACKRIAPTEEVCEKKDQDGNITQAHQPAKPEAWKRKGGQVELDSEALNYLIDLVKVKIEEGVPGDTVEVWCELQDILKAAKEAETPAAK